MPLTFEYGIINLAVEDLDRSLAFYAQKLGFEIIDRTSDDWTLLRNGPLYLALVPAGQPVQPQASSVLLVVPNINRALRELTRAGVQISEYYAEHDLAQFLDPDGHLLAVAELRRLSEPEPQEEPEQEEAEEPPLEPPPF